MEKKYCYKCGVELLEEQSVCPLCGAAVPEEIEVLEIEPRVTAAYKTNGHVDNANRNYITGIIGGVIGGFVAAIPWIIVYVYLNFIWSLLAAFIAMGVAFGYKLCNGKVTRAYPYIIIVTSFIVVIVTSLVIIPLLMFVQEGFGFNFELLKLYYMLIDRGELLKDLAIACFFTWLGISGVVKSERSMVE